MAFVRKSKFRHVFGQAAKKDQCYEGFRVTNCAFEGNFIAANGKWIAFCVEVGGGGAFVVLPHDKKGRLEPDLPKVSAHKEYVLDIQWSPFNDNMLASCSEDGMIKVWEVPDGGIVTNWDMDRALVSLDYHERRCVQISWHPIASNVLFSVSQEPKICIWNLDEGTAEVEIQSPDIIWNACWGMKGDKIVTSCKDKKFRIYDARSGDIIKEGQGHEGSKAQRVIFTMDDKYLFSCGFSRMSERQYCCWDAATMEELNLVELDTANGCLIPYYDPDTQIVYVAAKGDSVVRYYELVDEEPFFHYITTFQTNAAQRGLAPIPKRNVIVNDNEVFRFYKLHGSKTGIVEPISFTVPRKSDIFQEDLYPDAVSADPAIEAGQWFEGKNAEPNRIDMSTLFKGKVAKKATGGGGLKAKGGLKGLKAKKDAKDAAKAEAAANGANGDTNGNHAESTPAPKAAEPEPQRESKPAPAPTPAPAAAAATNGGGASAVDTKALEALKNEIKALKEKDRKRDDEIDQLRAKDKKRENDIRDLIERLQDYGKNIGDLKLLLEAVKKNDERIASLEALVQEESDEE